MHFLRIAAAAAVVCGVGLVGAPVVIPAVVTSLGFTSSGIAAGSWAAGFMASYGGMVPVGSACAVMQSIGALGTLAGAGVATISGAVTAATGAALNVVAQSCDLCKVEEPESIPATE